MTRDLYQDMKTGLLSDQFRLGSPITSSKYFPDGIEPSPNDTDPI